jgi:hypothetical protein
MTTRTEEFKQKLFALLREYEVEMQVEERFCGYTIIDGISFCASPKWDKEGEQTHEEIDLMLGTWEDGK